MMERMESKQLEEMREFIRKQEEKLATWRTVLACLEARTPQTTSLPRPTASQPILN